MTAEEAGSLIRRLLGCYPSQVATDPETYISALVSLLRGYPLWAGQRAVAKVAETTKFLPTIAEIKPLLEDQVKSFRYAADWEAGAQRLLAAPPPDPEHRRLMLEKFENLAGELRTRSAATSAEKRKTVDEIRDELVAQVGQEAFDALPNHPKGRSETFGDLAQRVMRKVESHA